MRDAESRIEVNGRHYAWPDRPLVVVCIDGSEPAYIERAVADGCMPFLVEALERGADLRAKCVMPSFTNPNNISIVTGVPPSVHGISGNYFLDPDTGAAVMMNDPKFLRVPTIFRAFQQKGARIAIVTAKDKLRRLLGHGLDLGAAVCFSSEYADRASVAENGLDDVVEMVGMAVPDVYSAELSAFALAAGVKLMEATRPDLMYLSTTDYVQHKHPPGSAAANEFYRMMDIYFGRLDALGATLALTADHGMSDKHGADGAPRVIYLQDILDDMLGAGAARVILPITDPYVVHHGALGGFATAYLPASADAAEIAKRLAELDGVACALERGEACRRFELPVDRIGDIVVVSVGDTALGASPDQHDLSGLDAPLRSHGGLAEQTVPLILSRAVTGIDPGRELRNFDVFDLALNHVAPAEIEAVA